MVNLNAKYQLNEAFYYSKNGEYLQFLNVAVDDSYVFRLSGACRTIFEKLAKGETLNTIQSTLPDELTDLPKEQATHFLGQFVNDLLEIGVLEKQ